MNIAYAAHTETCTFFLDEEGICRRVLRRKRANKEENDAAERCIGAQYVASMDVETRGGLIPMPRPGKPMIFAYIGKNGRIGLVRTGPIARFEVCGAPGQINTRNEGVVRSETKQRLRGTGMTLGHDRGNLLRS